MSKEVTSIKTDNEKLKWEDLQVTYNNVNDLLQTAIVTYQLLTSKYKTIIESDKEIIKEFNGINKTIEFQNKELIDLLKTHSKYTGENTKDFKLYPFVGEVDSNNDTHTSLFTQCVLNYNGMFDKIQNVNLILKGHMTGLIAEAAKEKEENND